ncbi:50S ribosomal protein L29 [Chloroflexota bacterium]
MRPDEAKALNDEELLKELKEAHKELFNLRFRLATKQLVNHREIPRTRRKIALLNTVIRARELGIS